MAAMDCIYLDYNATTPVDPRVAAVMEPFLSGGFSSVFGNPSSLHAYGKDTKRELQLARERVAKGIGSKSEEIVFCSGGTESINHVIKGVVFDRYTPGKPLPHLITSQIEHVAVLETTKWLVDMGFATCTYLPVTPWGAVEVEAVVACLKPETVLVSVMLANNEVGTVQPIADISVAVRKATSSHKQPVLIHTDASQVSGKLPIQVGHLGVDFLTIAGHKLYAPKGIGATYVRDGVKLSQWMHGAGQERGVRAGTENAMFAAALGQAFELAANDLLDSTLRLAHLRHRLLQTLESALSPELPKPIIHGAYGWWGAEKDTQQQLSLPNTLSVSFPGAFAAKLVGMLAKTVAVSAGAACHASTVGDPRQAQVSHVLSAMGVPKHIALCTLRLSLGRWSTEAEVDRAAELIAQAVHAVYSDTNAVLKEIEAGVVSSPAVKLETAPLFLQDTHLFMCGADVLLASRTLSDGMFFDEKGEVILPAAAGCRAVLALSATVAHPQGGGQPGDRGVVQLPTGMFEFITTRWGTGKYGGVIFHCGRWIDVPTALGTEHVANALPFNQGSAFPDAPPPAEVAGLRAEVHVSQPFRLLAARLHSAGHLLDLAVHNVYRRLEAEGIHLESLVPGKGYHFPDGPNVEYLGSIDGAWKDKMIPLLNEECSRLVFSNVPTDVRYVPQAPEELRKYKLSPEDCCHLPADKPVRVIMVGGTDNPCPCGGTHIRRTGELGGVVVTKIAVKKGRTKVSYSLVDPS